MSEKMKKDDNMTFVAVDGQPVPQPEEPEEPKNDEEKTEDKPHGFKKVLHVITAPARWVGRKLKEAPASAVVGGVIGGGVTLGVKAIYDHFAKGNTDSGEDETGEDESVVDNIVEFSGPTDDVEDEAM